MTRGHWPIDDCHRATGDRSWLRRPSRWRCMTMMAALSMALWCGGCGKPPQFPAKDMRLLEALRTAISAQARLARCRAPSKLKPPISNIKCPTRGSRRVQSVIAQRGAGDWKAADEQILRLEEGQHPPAK